MDSSTSGRAGGLRASLLHPKLPAFLSLALLAYQIALIWVVGAPTQDGPSHAYNALVLRELLFHRGSAFRDMYALNSYPTSNWASVVLVSISNLLGGPLHVEQAMATLLILFLYSAMYYAQKALSPQRALLWPGLNALLNIWMLWMGLYSFYLAMALSVFCVGYYIRHLRHLRTGHYLCIGLLMLVLYFTHPMGQVLTGVALSVVCIWDGVWRSSRGPEEASGDQRSHGAQGVLRSYVPLLLSMVPGAAFLLIFLQQEKFGRPPLALSWPELGSRLFFFPAEIFHTQGSDFSVRVDDALCALVLLAVFASVVLWKKADWLGTQGGLFLAAIFLLGIYLITPEYSGNAAFLKERLGWSLLVFSVVAVGASLRPRAVVSALAWFLLPFVGAQLSTSALWARTANHAREHYLPLERMIRPGSTLLRVNYPAEQFEKKHNLTTLNYDPMLHAVSGVALRKHCLNWSNYEAVTKAFPVVYRSLSPADKDLVGGFQDNEEQKAAGLESFLARFPVDNVIVYGELEEPGKSPDADEDLTNDFRAALELLNREYALVVTSGEGPVLRLYRKKKM